MHSPWCCGKNQESRTRAAKKIADPNFRKLLSTGAIVGCACASPLLPLCCRLCLLAHEPVVGARSSSPEQLFRGWARVPARDGRAYAQSMHLLLFGSGVWGGPRRASNRFMGNMKFNGDVCWTRKSPKNRIFTFFGRISLPFRTAAKNTITQQ